MIDDLNVEFVPDDTPVTVIPDLPVRQIATQPGRNDDGRSGLKITFVEDKQ